MAQKSQIGTDREMHGWAIQHVGVVTGVRLGREACTRSAVAGSLPAESTVLDFLFLDQRHLRPSGIQLKGKRIAAGPAGSGTRRAAEQILGKGGVNSETATLLPFAGSAAVEAMNDGEVDVVWIVGAPDASAVKSFLQNPNRSAYELSSGGGFHPHFP